MKQLIPCDQTQLLDIMGPQNVPYKGQRLSLKGQTCTVRYVGPVTGKAGDWLGVEWDDPTRGKNNGMYDGHQYFNCKRYFQALYILA